MLKRLIEQKLEEKGLSKAEAVRELGFDNTYMGMIEIERFMVGGSSDHTWLGRVADAFDIDINLLNRANRVAILTQGTKVGESTPLESAELTLTKKPESSLMADRDSRSDLKPKTIGKKFRPYIELRVSGYEGDGSVWLLNASQWRVLVPSVIVAAERNTEFNAVQDLYKMKCRKQKDLCLGGDIVGFFYHRTPDQTLTFNQKGKLVGLGH